MLIRVDANVEIGTGHVMRCLALGQAWQDAGGQVDLAAAEITPALQARISLERFCQFAVPFGIGSSEDAGYTADLARSRLAQWVVIDGYGFNAGYQERVRRSGAKILVIDDFGEREGYSADIILNQNLSAAEALYKNCGAQTRLLLGTSFVLLRREFRSWVDWSRKVPAKAHHLMVTMGGSDPDGITARISGTFSVTGLQNTFIMGGSTRDWPDSRHVDRALILKDQQDMASIMAKADIMIICCGGTLWESLFMGCATLAYTRNPVQEEIMKSLQECEAARWLGAESDLDCESLKQAVTDIAASKRVRGQMCSEGRKIVDGRGTQRVLLALEQFS